MTRRLEQAEDQVHPAPLAMYRRKRSTGMKKIAPHAVHRDGAGPRIAIAVGDQGEANPRKLSEY